MDQLLPQAGQPAPDLVAAMRYAALGPGKGRHARAAVGVASLPRGALVEIDAILHLA